MPGHTKCCTCHARSDAPTPLRKSQPGLMMSSDEMSLVLRLPRKMHLCRSSSHVPRLPSFLDLLQKAHVLLTFDKVHNPLRLPRETRSERPKVVRTWCDLYIFYLKMCFAPQPFALFRHLNFQKCSEREMFFHLQMCFAPQRCALFRHLISTSKVVRAWCALYISTSTCASRHNGVHFFDISTSKVVRSWCALYILTSKCASRHNGVHFFIGHLARWLRTRRFSKPTFRPPGASNHWKKHSVSGLSYLFAHLHLLSSDSSSSVIFSLLLFSSL